MFRQSISSNPFLVKVHQYCLVITTHVTNVVYHENNNTYCKLEKIALDTNYEVKMSNVLFESQPSLEWMYY